MNRTLKAALGISALVLSAQAAAQITFYEREGFRGRAFTTGKEVRNFERFGFNDRASSIVVDRGRWEVCEEPRYEGRCVLVRRGSYESLRDLGMNNAISSVRPAGRREVEEVAPVLTTPNYEYYRRPQERVFEAPVKSVRAVMGPPEQRCWVERQEMRGSDRDVGGAIAGAIIGGILGHQIGGGRGQDAATVGGAVAGAAIGSGAAGGSAYARDVRRCDTVASGPPAYWDVVYEFRGADHRVQMASAPGPTILVNQRGEPRQ